MKECHVRIIFEKENVDTMDSEVDLLITISSSQAQQEESHNLSVYSGAEDESFISQLYE